MAAGSSALKAAPSSRELFRAMRQANLALFRVLDRTQGAASGAHAERGVETIADIAEYYAGHDLNHMKQIESILAARGARKTRLSAGRRAD
jgi:hypothetical protein